MAEIFRRIEKKYIVNEEQYKRIKEKIADYMREDKYGKSTICNIYFDTDQYNLIQHSITKPYFKEKVRLRSYNVPNSDSSVFLEIKRKCNGVVGKRRIEMKLSEFNEYLNDRSMLKNSNMQIKKELDYYFKLYNLKPAMYISYSREAFYERGNSDFRLTFDSNITAREYDLDLELGSYGTNILEGNKYIMEVKTLGAMPMWFINILEEYKIIPGSFSKYGTAYSKLILKPNEDYLKELVLEPKKESKRINIKKYAIKEYAV